MNSPLDSTESASAGAPPGPRRGLPAALEPARIDPVLNLALEEDRGSGDLTSDNLLPAAVRARGRLIAKGPGRLAGLSVFARVFELCDPEVEIELLLRDGDEVRAGQLVLRLAGRARALLLAERTALNFLQRLSGIATQTARYVELAAGRARILDTRKTTPGLRLFEKYAVRCGGGENHREGLYDEAMIKDNHLDLCGSDLSDAVERLRDAVGPAVRITAEARDEAEALAAARGGADVILLDNMGPAEMARVAPLAREAARVSQRGRAGLELEASGGVTLENLAQVSASGVDRISVGALTHSVPALDLSLILEPAP